MSKNAKAVKSNGAVSVVMVPHHKECGSVRRFMTESDVLSVANPLNSAYVTRQFPGISEAKEIRVTVEVVS